MDASVLARLRRFLPRDFVKDARQRELLHYDKRIELNPDFKILWDKISQKTRYSVEFETATLIRKAIEKLSHMPTISPVKIEVTKRAVEITESGIEGGRVTSNRTYTVSHEQALPDILSFPPARDRAHALNPGRYIERLRQAPRICDQPASLHDRVLEAHPSRPP
jgi:type III restriction enzyme